MRLQCIILALFTPNRNKTQRSQRMFSLGFSVDENDVSRVRTRVVSPQKTAKEL